MARAVENVKDINDSRSLWKIAVRVKDTWTISNSKQKQHLEMIVCDDKGDLIQVIVPTDVNNQYKHCLLDNSTFTLQNFEIEKNDGSVKVCSHPFKLILNASTLIEEINQHKISNPGFKFTNFDDINNGKIRPDLLIDVIGVFYELGYTQLLAGGGRKLQINLKLKDLAGNLLPCTLWDLFDEQFVNFNKDKKDATPIIMLIHNAKIKEATDKYPLGVSNAWNSTKLFINDDLPDIAAFIKSLPIDDGSSSQSQQTYSASQVLSQTSSMPNFVGPHMFTNNAVVMTLEQLLSQTQNVTCVTVVKTLKVIPNKGGWYYKLCSQCSGAAKGDSLPIICAKKHETRVINLRFKLDVEVESNGVRSTFVFWDRECNELLGTTAAALHQVMIKVGVTNPLEYPAALDNIRGRILAIRVKHQSLWNSYSVQGIKSDEAIIKNILDQLPKDEETSKLSYAQPCPTPESPSFKVYAPTEDKICESLEDELVIETQNLSETSDHIPDTTHLTPQKRNALPSVEIKTSDPEDDNAPTQLSSTRLTRSIKKEKK